MITDRSVIGLGAAAMAIAIWAPNLGVPWWLAAAALIVATVQRWPRLGVVAVLVLVAARSHAAQESPGATSEFVHDGWVVLTTDPEPITRGLRMRVRLPNSGLEVEARAFGSPAGHLRSRLMGEQVRVVGRVSQLELPDDAWLVRTGADGRMLIDDVGAWRTGGVHHRVANSVRRTIESGAVSLGRQRQSLLAGLVYGDDRTQSAVVAADFAGSGLTHLLAVSGSNVAFVIVIAGPLLRRFGFRGRFIATLIVLFVFATMTRYEPSVMRASTMAAVAAWAVVRGRPAASVRVLALALIALVVIDPAIARSLGFQLSLAASAGIVTAARPIASVVPGPRPFADAVGVTTAAQLAVSPLIVVAFGDLPVAALPANLLAGPMAGPVMMWGLTAGWVAGIVGDPVAGGVHRVTGVGLDWIGWTAQWSADLKLGHLGAVHLLALVLAVAALLWAHRRPGRRVRSAASLVIAVALIHPGVALATAGDLDAELGSGARLWRSGSHVILVGGGAGADDLLAGLRRHGVDRVDLLVLSSGGYADWDRLRSLTERVHVGEVVAPSNRIIADVTVVDPGIWQVGGLQFEIDG